jgi:hypothetical protein
MSPGRRRRAAVAKRWLEDCMCLSIFGLDLFGRAGMLALFR